MNPFPEKGMILVAMPGLTDPNFRQTVVLLCQHDKEGSLGLILNRPTGTGISSLFPDSEQLRGRDAPVFEGGPVQKNGLMALYRGNSIAMAVPVFNDVYLTGNLEALIQEGVFEENGSDVRIYVGYAGWSPDQLQGELASGGWRLLPGNPDLVFGEKNSRAWPNVICSLGKEFEIYSEMPGDPSCN